MKYKKTTLPNGLRVITMPLKGNPSVMAMVAVETGSNYESKAENGLSHFLEHMVFKGTKKRPKAFDITSELDSLGAQNNASTWNEFTNYYAKASKKHFKKIFDIVSDLYLNSTLPAMDLEIERGVILQEISMYEDLPQYKVWEVLYKLMHGDTPAGRPTIGPKENIKNFTIDDFTKYRNKHYLANKTLIFVAGDVTEKKVIDEVKKHFKNINNGEKISKQKVTSNQKKPEILVEYKKTDQTHMILAFRAFGAKDKRSPAAHLLSEVMGQGMSSRLFHRLREEMGACYYVKSLIDQYTDHGNFVITTGIEAKRAGEVLEALLEECRKFITTPVGEEELNKAKEHLIGHMFMSLETSDDVTSFYLMQEIATGKMKLPGEVEKEIRKITSKDIMKVAKDIFKNNNLNLAIVGDIKDTGKLKKALKL